VKRWRIPSTSQADPTKHSNRATLQPHDRTHESKK
jgi:hypothetical protein